MKTNEQVARSKSALARCLGADRGSVARWIADGMPQRPDGAFAVEDCRRWLEERGEQSGDGEDWRKRKLRADALRAEHALAVDAGRFVALDEHHAQRLAIIDSFCSALEQMPSKLAPLLAGAGSHDEIVRQLHAYARSVRIQLAAKHSPPVVEVDAE